MTQKMCTARRKAVADGTPRWDRPAVGATELGAGWLRMGTVREDTAHGASVDQELLLAVVIL